MRGKMTEEEIKSENNGAEPSRATLQADSWGRPLPRLKATCGDSAEPEYEVVHHPHLFGI